MPRSKIILCCGFILNLAAGATISREDCGRANWRQVGEVDGRMGKSLARGRAWS